MPGKSEPFSRRIGAAIEQYKEASLLFGICVAAFGLVIPFLGYFWDDWTTLYLMKTSSSPWDFIYSPYRPLHAILDFISFRILGIAPLGWHILSTLLRWISAVLVFLLMQRLAPGKKFFAFAVAALFAVYPSFHQQSSALIYRQHWTTYIFFLGSLLLMIAAIGRKPGKRIWVMFLALLATLAHLLTTEYLLALELLRPIILWAGIPSARRTKRAHLRDVLMNWLPYLLILMAFFIWRFTLLDLPDDPNPPVLIPELVSSPVQTGYALIQTVLKDLVTVLWSSWTDLLQPALFEFSDIVNPMIWVVLLLITPWLYFALTRLVTKEDQTPPQGSKLFLILGLAGVLLGLGTSWIVGREVSTGLFSNRLTIPAMLGASILIALLLFSLVPKPAHRNLILAAMLAFAISGHLRDANDYRFDWERQRRAAWQFFWRAPTLAPGATVIGDGGMTTYLQEYNVSFAINLWYGQEEYARNPPYWFVDFFSGMQTLAPEAIAEGVITRGRFYGVEFNGNTHHSLMLVTNESPCLWFLSPADAANPLLDPRFADATRYADPAAVIAETEGDPNPIADIFGPEPDLGWCTLFQKAGLQAQLGNWQEVVSLWQDAESRTIDPYSGYELMNFVRAHAEIGDWEKAAELTLLAYEITPGISRMLCALWDGFSEEAGSGTEFVNAYSRVNPGLNCSN